MVEEIDVEELRRMVKMIEAEEKSKTYTTQLLDVKTTRQKIKKINPKFCEEWDELDLECKINRIIEFVGRYTDIEDISDPTGKKLRKLLVTEIKNSNLLVEYDKCVGQITGIPKLYYNNEDGYYLGTYLNDDGKFISHISKISNYDDTNLTITTDDYPPKEPITIIEEPIKPKFQLKLKKRTEETEQ
jgi:hypothetical protein